MQKNLYLGVMSGTSLDGVDLCLMDFPLRTDIPAAADPYTPNRPKLIAYDFTPMPDDLRTDLSELLKTGQTSLQKLGELDHRLGLLYADSINAFLRKQRLTATEIQAIGCHGQTVWHAPNSPFPFSMQIGDMNLVAARTGVTVIGDFRRKDMAFGGQGAPLVPAFHEEMFAVPNRLTVVLNIGGISNISVLSPQQPTIGYDVSVGNALMDAWIERHLGQRFDRNAEWARSGKIIPELLQDLLAEPFFRQAPPKSTGRELFNLDWLAKKLKKTTACMPQDVQRTLAEFTVRSVVNELKNLENETDNLLLVCGGGAHNSLLMESFAYNLPHWKVATTNGYGLNVDYVEAAAFAWLAYRRMHNLPSNLPAVTGARKHVSLGVIYPE